jgi:cytochrome c556
VTEDIFSTKRFIMRGVSRAILAAAVLLVVTVAVVACRRGQSDVSARELPEYTPTATIKDLMQGLIDPAADEVWLSVTTVMSQTGTVETVPKTDEDWAKVRHGAIKLMEASNLLIVPGRKVARPGEKSEFPGIELEPTEMEALIDKDLPGWRAHAKALHDAGLAALKAADARDPDKVFELGEQIEEACESCHSKYWYPNEKIPPPLRLPTP